MKDESYNRSLFDQGYSFTDCSSFVVMGEFKIRNVLTHDLHFDQAGFFALLR